MLKKITAIISTYLANFIELQLVITLTSLPILIAWGLPVSSMSLLSNLIFTPLLILFLWTACIFAICALLRLPCSFFATILDHITALWMWLLSFSKPSWLLGFSLQTFWVSILICIAIFMCYTYYRPTTKQAILFLTACCSLMLCARWCTIKPICKKVGDLPMIALHVAGKNYVIDYGALCSKQNYYNTIDYTIIPELIKHTGMTTVDTLVLYKPSPRLAKVALQCALQLNVKTIIAPQKYDCFKTLCIACADKNITVRSLPKNYRSTKNSSSLVLTQKLQVPKSKCASNSLNQHAP